MLCVVSYYFMERLGMLDSPDILGGMVCRRRFKDDVQLFLRDLNKNIQEVEINLCAFCYQVNYNVWYDVGSSMI